MKKLITFLFVPFLLGCEQDTVYQDIVELGSRWAENDTVRFQLDIDDISTPYDFKVLLRHSADYSYNNLYYTYLIRSPEGKIIQTQLKEVILFEPKTGRPIGSGLGDVFNNEFAMVDQQDFSHTGTYTIEILHYMRTDTLREIASVGLKVARYSPAD